MKDHEQADADPLDELTAEMRALFERWEGKLGHRPKWFDAVLRTLQPDDEFDPPPDPGVLREATRGEGE